VSLQLPKVPAPKGFHFAGVREHQLRQELADEIRQTIMYMVRQTYIPSYVDTLRRFLSVVESGEIRDPARLPYRASGPNDIHGTKIGCVYARLSFVIQLYWRQCLDGQDNAEHIRMYLAELRDTGKCGIDKCDMEGDIRHGFWLRPKP
jgi:hypothetical protein